MLLDRFIERLSRLKARACHQCLVIFQ